MVLLMAALGKLHSEKKKRGEKKQHQAAKAKNLPWP